MAEYNTTILGLLKKLGMDIVDFPVPEFSGTSYVKLPKLENVGRAFSLEVWFKTFSQDGVLVYNGQLNNGRGDFILLNLVDGFLQFKFDLGSGIANITSNEPVELDQWHRVHVSRLDKEGTLQLDNGTIIRGSSGPPLNELNLELPLYVGGVLDMKKVNREAGITTGLVGAVQRVLLNGQPWGHLSIEEGHEVTRYQGLPCPPNRNPCLNSGLCLPILDTFICKCLPKFTGNYCQQTIDVSENGNNDDDDDIAIRFNGITFLQYPHKLPPLQKSINSTLLENSNNSILVEDYWETEENFENENEMDMELEIEEDEDMYDDDDDDIEFFERRGKRSNRYEFSIRTSESNSLLLWTNKGKTLHNDYLAVALVDGFPELSFNLGNQQKLLTLRAQIQINDGEWHRVTVHRRKRQALLQIDNHLPVRTQSEPGAILLSTNARLFIGGAPALPAGLPTAYYTKYTGCMQRLIVNKKPVNFLMLNASLPIDFCHTV